MQAKDLFFCLFLDTVYILTQKYKHLQTTAQVIMGHKCISTLISNLDELITVQCNELMIHTKTKDCISVEHDYYFKNN